MKLYVLAEGYMFTWDKPNLDYAINDEFGLYIGTRKKGSKTLDYLATFNPYSWTGVFQSEPDMTLVDVEDEETTDD